MDADRINSKLPMIILLSTEYTQEVMSSGEFFLKSPPDILISCLIVLILVRYGLRLNSGDFVAKSPSCLRAFVVTRNFWRRQRGSSDPSAGSRSPPFCLSCPNYRASSYTRHSACGRRCFGCLSGALLTLRYGQRPLHKTAALADGSADRIATLFTWRYRGLLRVFVPSWFPLCRRVIAVDFRGFVAFVGFVVNAPWLRGCRYPMTMIRRLAVLLFVTGWALPTGAADVGENWSMAIRSSRISKFKSRNLPPSLKLHYRPSASLSAMPRGSSATPSPSCMVRVGTRAQFNTLMFAGPFVDPG